VTIRRVLHLIDSWGAGGAETVFADLATGLDPARVHSLAAVPRPTGWLHDELVRRGVEPAILPSGGAFDLRHLARVVALIRRERVDLVQAHTFGTTVYAGTAGFLCRVPVVATFHGFVDLARDDARRAIKLRALAAGTRRVVCVSQSLRRALLEESPLRPEEVAVIFNGVDVTRFRPGRNEAIRRELGVADDELLIGAVGNVRRPKGYEILLEAAALLAREGIRCRIVVAGIARGPLFAELEERHAALGLGSMVRFIGFRDDVDDFYRALDIYLLTSHSEGFSLSTVQALASGLPVVATRCGGPEEIVTDGVDGVLTAAGSPREIAAAISALANDPARRGRLAGAARVAAESRFSTEAMLGAYEELYEELTPRG
jgi:glycosyltransferase involved in cell wall biosynthesis